MTIGKQRETYKVSITGYTHDGAGVGRIDKRVVFVQGALLGEEVEIEVTGKRKGVLFGKIRNIIVPHSKRINPLCDVYDSCGGCQLQHVSYDEQVEIKKKLVEDSLQRLGKFKNIEVLPVLKAAEPWGYRNKGSFRVVKKMDRVILGFYEEGSHTVIPQFCRYLFSQRVAELLEFLEQKLTEYNISIGSENDKGLHHILIRESRINGEIMLVFVVSGVYLAAERERKMVREIKNKFPQVVSICRNYKKEIGGLILGVNTAVIAGKSDITEGIGSFLFKISPPSFFQVNSRQAEILYEKTLEYAKLKGTELVVDAYCGTGTISHFLSQKARKVIGIEVIPEAIKDAEENLENNGIDNVGFIQGKVEEILPRLEDEGLKPDVVVVDPPRRGCATALLESIVKIKPDRIVYVSCNPSTLARDLRYLIDEGFAVEKVQPVDMFPQTTHVECVIGMQRKDT